MHSQHIVLWYDEWLMSDCELCQHLCVNIPYFLEISPRRHLISWFSLARRHFEGGQISRAATKVLVVRIVRYLESTSIYAHARYVYARNNDDDPLPHAARIRGRRLVH